jgi:hypothetical protein
LNLPYNSSNRSGCRDDPVVVPIGSSPGPKGAEAFRPLKPGTKKGFSPGLELCSPEVAQSNQAPCSSFCHSRRESASEIRHLTALKRHLDVTIPPITQTIKTTYSRNTPTPRILFPLSSLSQPAPRPATGQTRTQPAVQVTLNRSRGPSSKQPRISARLRIPRNRE